MAAGRGDEFEPLVDAICAELGAAHRSRETGLAACRQVIRSCGSAIRAVHQGRGDDVRRHTADAKSALDEAHAALEPHPAVAFAGFLHDAEKEYAEALITVAVVDGSAVPSHVEVGVEGPAWLRGLAEAASELRRHLLDKLRVGEFERAEELLAAMDDAYSALVRVDFPDALTGGLRRTTDSLRAVLERTRGDLTITLVQARLQAALESNLRQ
jgi:translin